MTTTASRTARSPRSAPRFRPPRWLRILLPAVLILAWLAVFGLGGRAFGEVGKVAVNDASEHLPASAEATQVQDLEKKFRDGNAIPATIVFTKATTLTPDDLRTLTGLVAGLAGEAGVASDRIPGGTPRLLPSQDGRAATAFIPVQPNDPGRGVKVAETVTHVRAQLAGQSPAGVVVNVTGPAGLSADISGAFSGLDGLLLAVALAVVLLILVIVYRSPLLPLMVLGTSLMALTGAMALVVALAKAGMLLLSGQTQGILMILVIGAATDYSLLYVSRYREELALHESTWAATWAALRGSFEPVSASAGTVIAAVLCLTLSDLNANKALGPVAAIGIGFAYVASLTLLPALLYWAGRVAYWPGKSVVERATTAAESGPAESRPRGLWHRVSRLVSARPRTVWAGSLVVLLALGAGAAAFKADGVPSSDFVVGHSDARDGQAALAAHFPAGAGEPAVVVAPADRKDGVVRLLSHERGVSTVRQAGTAVDGLVMLEATLSDAPESAAAEETVKRLRADIGASGWHGDVLVGGPTAVALDTNETTIRDRNLIIPVVLAVILVILMLLLRSLVAPVLLVGTVVASFAAALGVSAFVFNGLFHFPGADASVPLFGFVFLVALGVDYNIFLMSRVREESLRHGTHEGILRGLRATGGVITSAGVVLAATFAALGVLPVLFLAQISFIVAFGVLLDTVLVRSLLVPALCYDLGERTWWPARGRAGA
ncbi:MMPL family transporter [Sinomonas atrocyanea]|uniref:MMPL family transporter n=1 Tax=Sinomonas atrocyanea TaxID=37927 RepID=UPI0027815150|nr:MMPL family transporter [Sinomonas atrocyanea]MDQ0261525.1 RND superfamily putative drug exporter [Sinomonas atrocyanea]MDR6623225.1 RND superfamily putative drug exporter [Sinomonas atrocyanea]